MAIKSVQQNHAECDICKNTHTAERKDLAAPVIPVGWTQVAFYYSVADDNCFLTLCADCDSAVAAALEARRK